MAGPGAPTLTRLLRARTVARGASDPGSWHGDAMSAPTAPQQQATDPDTKLSRSVGGRLLYLFILGDVLGAGVYALVGEMAARWAAPSGCRSSSPSASPC